MQDLNGKGHKIPISDPQKFDELLLDFSKSDVGKKLQTDSTIGLVNKKLVYFQIVATSIGKTYDSSALKQPILEKWEKYMEEYRNSTIDSLKSAQQTSGFNWAWMASEKAFVSSAMSGIGIAMIFSFLILLLATKNIILAVLSILCVSVVIISVLAIMVLKEWSLGVSESISVVILIGLAVDYVIHLAQDYTHSVRARRHDKI